MFEIEPEVRGVGAGWGDLIQPVRYSTYRPTFAALFSKIWAGPAVKMFDRAQKRAPRLSGGSGERCASCRQSVEPTGRADSPAAFWRAP